MSSPPKARTAAATPGCHRGVIGDVHPDTDGDITPAEFGGHLDGPDDVQVGDDHVGAVRGEQPRNGQADTRCGAGDQGHLAGQRLGLRPPVELVLFQLPVLDGELVRLADRLVLRHPLHSAHHVDGVEVELAGDASGLLVAAEREHPDARDQDDGRIGAPDRGSVRAGVSVVVRLVVDPVFGVQFGEPLDHLVDRRVDRRVQQQWTHLGTQEMVGAGGAQRHQLLQLAAGHEVENHVAVGEMADHPSVGGRNGAQMREELSRPVPTSIPVERFARLHLRAERLRLGMPIEVALSVSNDLLRPPLDLVAGAPPGGQPVATEHGADHRRVGRQLAHGLAQFPAGPLPRHPGNRSAPDLPHQPLTVGRAGQSDHRIRMQMIDVGLIDQPVHRCVD